MIQNVQETEEALEELKQKYQETEKQMEEKTHKLQRNIDDLKAKISQETEKAEQLKKRTKGKEKAGTQQMLLQVQIELMPFSVLFNTLSRKSI